MPNRAMIITAASVMLFCFMIGIWVVMLVTVPAPPKPVAAAAPETRVINPVAEKRAAEQSSQLQDAEREIAAQRQEIAKLHAEAADMTDKLADYQKKPAQPTVKITMPEAYSPYPNDVVTSLLTVGREAKLLPVPSNNITKLYFEIPQNKCVRLYGKDLKKLPTLCSDSANETYHATDDDIYYVGTDGDTFNIRVNACSTSSSCSFN